MLLYYIYIQGNEMGETLSRYAGDIRMPQHNLIHRELVIYADLMLWLKKVDEPVFHELSSVCIKTIYAIGLLIYILFKFFK